MYSLVPLDAVESQDRLRIGGKAFHLGRMARAGLPVPAGVVVPSEAFLQALSEAGALPAAQAVARDPSESNAKKLSEKLACLRLSEKLSAELSAISARFGRVAVRSSAIDEDGRTSSYAGQHDSFLSVDADGLEQAVLSCWMSLYTDRALAYRRRSGRGPSAGGMAVVIQTMVAPDVSGVLFTINPLNGSWREMVVESTWGLGEGLASGQITPHWFLVRRPRSMPRPIRNLLSRVRLQLVQQDLPDISERWRAGPDGKVVREPVPRAFAGRSSLDRERLLSLCRMGLRVEEILGEPQDIEWAIAGDRIFLVQARPITTAGPPRQRDDVLWTRRFIGERWPEPATPLGWSLLAPIFDWFIAYPETQLRHLGGGPALKLVKSRPYINATVFRHLVFKFPGAPAPSFMLELVPPEEEFEWQRRFAMLPGVGVYASILRETLLEKRWERFKWNPLTNPTRWEEYCARLESSLPAVSRSISSELDGLGLVKEQLELIRDYVGVHVTSLLFANLFYQILDSFLSVWLPEDAARLMEHLAICPPGNLTLETNEAVWQLAQKATDADLAALGAGKPLKKEFDLLVRSFLRQYGHRSAASWEVFSPRWTDHPEMLAPLLQVHRLPGADEPLAKAREQQTAFDSAIAEARQKVGWTQRPWLDMIVHYTRTYLLLRENQRFWFDRLLLSVQRTLYAIGELLAQRQVLQHPHDIAYLTWPEVQGVGEGSLPHESVKIWVERRKAQRESDIKENPPIFLRGEEAVVDPSVGARLSGLGISPGRARGKVRILRTPGEAAKLAPGEILVTHAVDPGWTPAFVNAAAIILEMGGRLSHGAVVAREYHIPGVVNIEGVTRRLTDGQEVTVDGTRGIVWIHP